MNSTLKDDLFFFRQHKRCFTLSSHHPSPQVINNFLVFLQINFKDIFIVRDRQYNLKNYLFVNIQTYITRLNFRLDYYYYYCYQQHDHFLQIMYQSSKKNQMLKSKDFYLYSKLLLESFRVLVTSRQFFLLMMLRPKEYQQY